MGLEHNVPVSDHRPYAISHMLLSPMLFRPRILILIALLTLPACGSGGDGKASSTPDITVAQLNVLHGTTGMCPQMANCRLEDRADLLAQWIKRSGCPDVVTLQEGWSGW